MSKLWNDISGNFTFILVCVLTVAVLVLLARGLEKILIKNGRRTRGARYIAYVAMFSAMGGALMLLEIPLFFAPSFYKMDLSELPVLMCSFYLGPVAGVTAEFLKVFIKLLLKGTSTAFVGDYANFVVGCCYILPASAIYHAHKSKATAVTGMAVGTLVMAVFGSVFNALYLIPKFAQLYGMPIEAIVEMGTAVNSHIASVPTLALYAVAPFNLLKGICDGVLTFLLYKRLEKVFFKEEKNDGSSDPSYQRT